MLAIFLTKEATRELSNLDKNIRETVVKKIDMIARHPNLGRPLKENLVGYYKFPVRKNYRIIYQIEDNAITVITIEHRATVYR